MTASQNSNRSVRIMTIGLQPSEIKNLQKIAHEAGGIVHIARNDLDLSSQAHLYQFDLYVFGQCEEIPNPSYCMWLLKGVATHCGVILIYSSLPKEEQKRIGRFHATHVLGRPVDPHLLAKTVDSALNDTGENRESLWSALTHWLPLRWKHA